MKKIFALSLSVLLCTVVFAGGTDDVSSASGVAVVMRDATTFRLIYKAEKAGYVKVSILDSKHKIVFSESIKTIDGFIRPYNFQNLKEGDYTLEIVDDKGVHVEEIHNYSTRVEKLFNVRKIDTDKVILSVSGMGEETIQVKIYDGSDALVYDEEETITGDFAKIYNLKNLQGTVTLVVTGENGQSKSYQY